MESQKRMRVNSRHWDLLLDLLEEHPEMITGKFVCQNAKQTSVQLWQNAATKLNALGLGEKTPEKWKLAVQDWKYKTKMKIAEIKDHEKKTGGGPPLKIKLNDQEERLMNIVGWTAALGNESVPESGLMPLRATLEGHVEWPKAGTSTEQEFDSEVNHTHSNVPLDDDQVEEIIMNFDNSDPSTSSSKKQKTDKKPLTSTKRKTTSDDILGIYQTETMEVLKEISVGIKSISMELKSISESLSVISKKSDNFLSK